MTRIAIVGGKLQGTEAAYLAKKAGIESLLIDYNEQSPAAGLCDEFLCCDVTKESRELLAALDRVDVILPANENDEVLEALERLAVRHNYVLAFDRDAYAVSSSKLLSDRLIYENGIPAPRYYPNCKAPFVVKPSGFSGSEGVKRIETKEEVELFLKTASPEETWVAQEFLTGPSYSIEVVGEPGAYQTFEVTEIHMDSVYDCKKVTAPCPITGEQEESFRQIAVKLAELLKLKGIMDVEVIDDGGMFKVLEIDARIPSQTPTAVYHTTGVNLVEELVELFCQSSIDDLNSGRPGSTERSARQQGGRKRHCSYEHLLIEDGSVTEHGEHIMSGCGPLRLRENFFGADEVISDFAGGELPWRGTFINWADTEEALDAKRKNMRLRLLSGREGSEK